MHILYVFNPSHDLALANGSVSYMSPESTRRFTNDLAYLPAWYAERGQVLVPRGFHWQPPIPLPVYYITTDKLRQKEFDQVLPWGWNESLCKQLHELGIALEVMPSHDELQQIRLLSHRTIARHAMLFMHERHPSWLLPEPCEMLTDMDEVASYVASHDHFVFKAPWSGSGKGIFFAQAPLTDSLSGWCRRTIYKQGSVMAEPALAKVQDFAMEFLIDENRVAFAGYSLFESEPTGIYRANRLMSDEEIEQSLAEWVDVTQLEELKVDYIEFLTERVMPHYKGYVGVDMMVYQQDEQYHIDPAVELNLRMTMGMVARLFYDRYVAPGHKGWFYIDNVPQGLFRDHRRLMEEFPLVTENGRITSGYLSLCPIEMNTQYRVRVMMDSE